MFRWAINEIGAQRSEWRSGSEGVHGAYPETRKRRRGRANLYLMPPVLAEPPIAIRHQIGEIEDAEKVRIELTVFLETELGATKAPPGLQATDRRYIKC